MADSTLDPDNIPAGADRTLGRGHGTRALGPSDNSDSGSDVVGEPTWAWTATPTPTAPASARRGRSQCGGGRPWFRHVESIRVVMANSTTCCRTTPHRAMCRRRRDARNGATGRAAIKTG